MGMDADSAIYSIGHGSKPIDGFLEELTSFGIECLVDVRSRPYSKWNPDFNTESLRLRLKEHGIVYGFMGGSLGGVPADRSFYDGQGRIVYEALKRSPLFLEGLERLHNGMRQHRIALLCSEADPAQCHRTKLIGAALSECYGVSIRHIVAKNRCKTQEEVMAEVTGGVATVDLFGEPLRLTSRKSH